MLSAVINKREGQWQERLRDKRGTLQCTYSVFCFVRESQLLLAGHPGATEIEPDLSANEIALFKRVTQRILCGSPRDNFSQSGRSRTALQDYEMQLLLLEQQNKKRLMMARDEEKHRIAMLTPAVFRKPGAERDPRMHLSSLLG